MSIFIRFSVHSFISCDVFLNPCKRRREKYIVEYIVVFIFTVNLIWIVTQIQSDTFTKLLDIHFTFRSTFGYIHNWLTNVHYFPALDIYEVSFDLIFVPLYLSGWHPGVVSRFGEVGTISKHSNMNHNHGIHPFYSKLLELRDGVKGCHSIYFDLIHHH